MEWQIQNEEFSIEVGKLKICANAGCLKNGVSVFQSDQLLAKAFAVADQSYQEHTAQTYVRGNDIFASFEKNEFDAEIYWRIAQAEEECVLLESVVSLRSSKLTTQRIQFALEINNQAGFEHLDDVACGFFNKAAELSWFLIPHPADVNEIHLSVLPQGAQVDLDIPWLERGVIRRLRILMAVCGGKPSRDAIQKIANQFAKSEIPLTT